VPKKASALTQKPLPNQRIEPPQHFLSERPGLCVLEVRRGAFINQLLYRCDQFLRVAAGSIVASVRWGARCWMIRMPWVHAIH
jgi:hypothetical protein